MYVTSAKFKTTKRKNNMKTEIAEMLNNQINAELYSAYIYLGFSAFLDKQGFPGFAKWYKVQSKEELSHAMKIYDYLVGNEGDICLKEIKAPERQVNSLADVFNYGLSHERYVTKLINEIYAKAKQEDDYRTEVFLYWFVIEQYEEEKNATELLYNFNMYGDTGTLYKLDKEAGERT